MKQAEIYVNDIRCGIPSTVAIKMIERMKNCLPQWEQLIMQSFLPEKMKTDYCRLLNQSIVLTSKSGTIAGL